MNLREALQRACDIGSVARKGVLGDTYYITALHSIKVAQLSLVSTGDGEPEGRSLPALLP